jgi:hypothetical protein
VVASAGCGEPVLENGLPVTVIPVAMHEDAEGRRFIDVDAKHEPTLGLGTVTARLARSAAALKPRRPHPPMDRRTQRRTA